MPPSLRPFERVAHRGASREFPENTLPAFERALERGADAIELDVHATADGVVVVHHDPCFGETVDGAGRGRRLDSVGWGELQGIELTPGITVPSLAQVLDLVGARGTVYVELKAAAIEEVVIETVRNATARCQLHSFHHDDIARAARLAPDIPRGLLFDRRPRDVGRAMREVGAVSLWPDWRIVDRALVDDAHAAGGRVIAWTVNTRATAAHLLDLGVDALCSDDVRLFGD